MTLSVRVDRIQPEAIDIVSLRLSPEHRQALPPSAAGSHVDVHLAPGLVRQYSLCNGPDEQDHYLIAVKREPNSRGGSSALHTQVKPGDRLTVGPPRNNFPLHAEAAHHVLLAGGIGITPILSMAKHLESTGASYQLEYFTRSPQHAAFRDLLSSPPFGARVHFHYAAEPDALPVCLGHLLQHRSENAHLYVCGPRPFMDLAQAAAVPAWPSESVHVEYFAADPGSSADAGAAFEVKLTRTGRTYVVPEGKTIVQVLAENGIPIEVSCEQGICGTCLTGVLEGTPDHRDMFLTDDEKRAGDKLTPCVSRAKSRLLVLDL
jgi:vanillate O-demethylase ferredoxin subunit